MPRTERYQVSVDATETSALAARLEEGRFAVTLTGESSETVREVVVLKRGNPSVVLLGTRVIEVWTAADATWVQGSARATRVARGPGSRAQGTRARAVSALHAPMPGRIVSVNVVPGERVQRGQVLVVIEAMKMQNELVAEADGTVHRVLVEQGVAVERGAPLVRFD